MNDLWQGGRRERRETILEFIGEPKETKIIHFFKYSEGKGVEPKPCADISSR